MSYSELNIGTVANDGEGDSFYTLMSKIKDNFEDHEGRAGSREITYSLSGKLTTMEGGLRRYIQKTNFVISKIIASVGTTPVGSAVTFDIKKDGVGLSILTEYGSIESESHLTTITSFENDTVEIDSYLTVDIISTGNVTSGSDLTITLFG